MRVPQIFNYETEEYEQLPHKWEICGHCRGNGTTSAHMGSFSQAELNEDPDFAEDYFAGRYDRACDCCDGTGKVMEADLDRMSEELKKRYFDELRADAEYASEVAYERRMLCGGL